MSDTTVEPVPDSDGDLQLARRLVEKGSLTDDQVRAAVDAWRQTPGSLLRDHLPIPREQIRGFLEAPTRVPPEAAEAMKKPANRVGRYWRANRIGGGGMGVVYRGWDEPLGRWVALKFLKSVGDEQTLSLFRREAHVAASLDHPHIAKIYEIGEHEGLPFIAMQLVEGSTLVRADLRFEEKLEVAAKLAEAVFYAHSKKVIHRDLKPANVMRDATGHVFVMDFGLAKETKAEGESLLGTTAIVGTPNYMAPEQARGKATPQSDVYGVGAILYELVTGRAPFVGETTADVLSQVVAGELLWPRSLVPGLPEDLEAILLKALEKEPSRRYSGAKELIEDLAAFRQREPLRHARRPTLAYVLGKRIRKRPLQWAFGSGLIIAILGGAAFGVTQLLRAKREAEKRVLDVTAERDRTEAQRRITEEQRVRAERSERVSREKLAYSLHVQARREADAGNDLEALFLHYDAYREHPLPLYGAAVGEKLRSCPRLKAVLPIGGGEFPGITSSPDGSRLAVKLHEDEVQLVDPRAGEIVGSSLRHGATIRWFFFRADSAMLLTCGGPKLRFWNATTGALEGESGFEDDDATHFEISGDWKRGVTVRKNSIAAVFDMKSGQEIGPRFQARGTITVAALNRDGTRLLLVAGKTGENSVSVTEVDSRKLAGPELRHPGTPPVITAAAIHPDGTRIATAGIDRSVRLWDVAAGREIGSPMRHRGSVDALSFTADGRWLASGGGDKTARLWDSETGAPIVASVVDSSWIRRVAVAPDGSWLAAAGLEDSFRIWDVQSAERRPEVSYRMPRVSLLLSHVSPGGLLIELSEENTARVRDLVTGKNLGTPMVHQSPVVRTRLAPDGNRAATGTEDGSVSLWNPRTGESIGLSTILDGPVQGLVFTEDGRRLLVWGKTSARVFDANTGTPVGEPMVNGISIQGAAISPTGTRVAVLAEPKSVRLWDPDRTTSIMEPVKLQYAFVPVFSSDGSRVAIGGVDSWRVHDAATGTPLGKPLPGGTLAFASSGRRVAIAFGNRVRLFDPESGEAIGALIDHREGFTEYGFSPDGRWLATAGEDQVVRLSSAETGEAVGKPMVHSAEVSQIAFGPDGAWLVSRCEDGTVRIWEVPSGEALGSPLRTERSPLSVRFSEEGARLISEEPGGWICLWNVGYLRPPDATRLGTEILDRTGVRRNERGELEVASRAWTWTKKR